MIHFRAYIACLWSLWLVFLVIFGNFILQVVEALRDFQKISLQKI